MMFVSRKHIVAVALALGVIAGTAFACHSRSKAENKGVSLLEVDDVDAVDVTDIRAGEWADSVMAGLSLRERVAQLFVPRLDITNNKAGYQAVDQAVAVDKMGGFLLGKGTIASYADLINRGQSKASVPLMITLDGEWGLSMRVSGTPRFPYNIALGAGADEAMMYAYGREMARECRLMGIQVNFAPDMDVNSNPDNPVIGYRSFGEDPGRVGMLGSAYCRGMWDEGVMPVGKHFPGHGDTSVDSHKALPMVDHDSRRMMDVDIKPFVMAIRDGMPAIMVGHLKVPSLDPSGIPASLSKKITTDLLQTDLGFEGLVFTDALAMKGALLPNENNCVSAFLAGADILLGSSNPSADLKAVVSAVNSGKISKAEVDRRCRKVLVYKYKLGLSRRPHVDATGMSSRLNTPQVDSLISEMSRSAITVVRDDSGMLPFAAEKSVAVVSIGAPAKNAFSEKCKAYGNMTCYSVENGSVVSESLLKNLCSADAVVIGVFKDAEWSRNALAAIASVRPSVGVFFMNPFKLPKFSGTKSLTSLVLAYDDIPQLRVAAAEALFGRISVVGSLPVDLPGVGKIGDGVKF